MWNLFIDYALAPFVLLTLEHPIIVCSSLVTANIVAFQQLSKGY